MRIGTLTFHWASNYGAVIQAYALQHYLRGLGHTTEIINYVPLRVAVVQTLARIRNGRFSELAKGWRLRRFRREHLAISNKLLLSGGALAGIGADYDVYVCGSDQIWNESFIRHSRRAPSLSYFLDFVRDDRLRIAYAASFGTEELSAPIAEQVRPLLLRFDHIGVREVTGKQIVENLGLDASIVADPSLLIDRECYEALISDRILEARSGAFAYILHEHQCAAAAVWNHVRTRYPNALAASSCRIPLDMMDWLAQIRNAGFMVTNSFHGVVFAVLFHTPFVALPVAGSRMNDRIHTLLSSVGLLDRIVDTLDVPRLDGLLEGAIDWERVDAKVQQLRSDGEAFIARALRVDNG